MSEQYAFAIGFDREPEELSEQPDDSWMNMLQSISTAIVAAGLPPIESARWDEFGQGRVFWGTQAECDAVRAVLERFDLYIEEDRNLEQGYYATVDHTYYVDFSGQIYAIWNGLIDPGSPLEIVHAIPLDAYRFKTVDPDLSAQVQAKIQSSHETNSQTPLTDTHSTEKLSAKAVGISAPLSEPHFTDTAESQLSAVSTVPLTQYQELLQQLEQQSAQITDLEQELKASLAEIDRLRDKDSSKVDRSIHDPIQLQCDQQTREIERITTELNRVTEQWKTTQAQIEAQSAQIEAQSAQVEDLSAQIEEREQANAQALMQVSEWRAKSEQAVDAGVYEETRQHVEAQETQILELQRLVQRLEQQLEDASAQAKSSISPSRYESLEQDLADKSTLIADLRQTIQQQERDLREWQTVAEAKVDWAEHQELQQELQRLQSRQKRGLFARLFGWLWK